MKKIIYLFLLAFICVINANSQVSFAEKKDYSFSKNSYTIGDKEDYSPKNVLKVNYFSWFIKTFSGFYERVLKDDISIQLGGSYTSVNLFGTKLEGYALTPAVRFYLSNYSAPKGFYVEPFLRYQNFNLTDIDSDGIAENEEVVEANYYGGGMVAGFQLLLKNRITFDWFVGPYYLKADYTYQAGKNSSNTNVSIGKYEGMSVRFGGTFGIAF